MSSTPVLFIVFNRPETTRRVFEAIRAARPERLYVAADGPRSGRPEESARCALVRQIATAVDWPCDVQTRFLDENLGCGRAVTAAIDWFFEHEPAGIILEDDTLPHPDFFGFCGELLDRYATDERIGMIRGFNPMTLMASRQRRAPRPAETLEPGSPSYSVSKYNHVWGWASWRRAWRHHDLNMRFWPRWRGSRAWRQLFRSRRERWFWRWEMNRVYFGDIDTWDYQWQAACWYRQKLVISPRVNLVSNIGFGEGATHTKIADDPFSELPTMPLGPIVHPESLEPDSHWMEREFDIVIGRGRKAILWRVGSLLRELRRRVPPWLGGRTETPAFADMIRERQGPSS